MKTIFKKAGLIISIAGVQCAHAAFVPLNTQEGVENSPLSLKKAFQEATEAQEMAHKLMEQLELNQQEKLNETLLANFEEAIEQLDETMQDLLTAGNNTDIDLAQEFTQLAQDYRALADEIENSKSDELESSNGG